MHVADNNKIRSKGSKHVTLEMGDHRDVYELLHGSSHRRGSLRFAERCRDQRSCPLVSFV